MNKEKLIEFVNMRKDKLHKEYETVEAYGEDAEEIAWFSARLEECNLFKQFIQSEPEEKTNFDVITESPEKLAYWLNIISMARTVFYPGTGEISFNDNGLIEWLNQKAGE